MTKEEWIKEQFEDDDFTFRLAWLSRKHTGLPMVVMIDVKDGENKNIPRLLFNDAVRDSWEWETLLPISLDKENPELILEDKPLNLSNNDISILKAWIIKYYDDLMKVWNGEIFQSDFIISYVNSHQ